MLTQSTKLASAAIEDLNIKAVLGEISLAVSTLAAMVELNDELLKKLLIANGFDKQNFFERKNKMITDVEADMKELAMKLWGLEDK